MRELTPCERKRSIGVPGPEGRVCCGGDSEASTHSAGTPPLLHPESGKDVPQGLKPWSFLLVLSARLKQSPDS